jgi:hypothetical protein
MSTISISQAFTELFSAPLKSVVQAEEDYLRLWINRLQVIQKLFVTNGKWKADVDMKTVVAQYAPAVRLEGRIDTALTLRVAGVREISANASVGLALGPVHASGGFGFVSRNTHESIFQASTSFALSNKEFSLTNYLEAAKLPLVTAADLNNAIKHLGADLKSRSELAVEPMSTN